MNCKEIVGKDQFEKAQRLQAVRWTDPLQDKRHEDTCWFLKRWFQIPSWRLAYNVCCKKDGSIKDLL